MELYEACDLHQHHDFIASLAGTVVMDHHVMPYFEANNITALERCAIIDAILAQGE